MLSILFSPTCIEGLYSAELEVWTYDLPMLCNVIYNYVLMWYLLGVSLCILTALVSTVTVESLIIQVLYNYIIQNHR
jgi:hypothetical protein